MGDGDGRVVAFEEGTEGLVDEGFGLGVEGGCCWNPSVSMLECLGWKRGRFGKLYLRLGSKYPGS